MSVFPSSGHRIPSHVNPVLPNEARADEQKFPSFWGLQRRKRFPLKKNKGWVSSASLGREPGNVTKYPQLEQRKPAPLIAF